MLARCVSTVQHASFLSWLASPVIRILRAGALRRALYIIWLMIAILDLPRETKEILEQPREAKVVDLGIQVRDIEREECWKHDKAWVRYLPMRKGFAELYERIKEPPTPLRYIGVNKIIGR